MKISNNNNIISQINLKKNQPKKVGQNFADILKEGLEEANSLKLESNEKTQNFLMGKTDNIHEVMIAAQKAEVSISFVTEVRNRIVEAYQEFSRMQV